MAWAIIMVVLASDIDLVALAIEASAPLVTSLLWVATSTKVNVNALVAERKLFANGVDGVDWLAIPGSQVMLALWQAPASVVAVSSEDGDVAWLEGHDHGFEVLESSELVERLDVAFAHLTTSSCQGTHSLF